VSATLGDRLPHRGENLSMCDIASYANAAVPAIVPELSPSAREIALR
jgi:hypothetical protein